MHGELQPDTKLVPAEEVRSTVERSIAGSAYSYMLLKTYVV